MPLQEPVGMHRVQPAWLNERNVRAKDSPRLAQCSTSAISSALGVSWVYANTFASASAGHIHGIWEKLAQLVGVSPSVIATFRILKPDGSTLYNNINQLSRIGVLTLDSTTTYTIIWDPASTTQTA